MLQLYLKSSFAINVWEIILFSSATSFLILVCSHITDTDKKTNV